MPATGGTRKLIRADAIQPAWAPDSKRLVFRQHSDGAIRTINKNGSGETFVVAAGSDPAWSPDGRFIAYADGGDIWKVRVNSSGMPLKPPVQVTTDPADDGQPSWSFDSQFIAFHSARSGDYDLWTVPATGGSATRLTGTVGQGDYDPSLSANGRFAAYSGFTASPLQKAASQNDLAAPAVFNLAQNYPNPFNPETEIHFQLPEASHVVVKIFNALGAEVRTLTDGQYQIGSHHVRWDGKDNSGRAVASGVYLYQLRAGPSTGSGRSFSQVRRMNLLR